MDSPVLQSNQAPFVFKQFSHWHHDLFRLQIALVLALLSDVHTGCLFNSIQHGIRLFSLFAASTLAQHSLQCLIDHYPVSRI